MQSARPCAPSPKPMPAPSLPMPAFRSLCSSYACRSRGPGAGRPYIPKFAIGGRRRGREARSIPCLDIDLTRNLAVSEMEDDVLDVVASVRQGHEEGEGDPLLAEHFV